MRHLIYVCCASVMVVTGCVTASDPIDRLATTLSSDPRWQNGFTPGLPLHANASTEEIIAAEFAGSPGGYKILETREVRIKGIQRDSYTAVLLQTEAGEEIALIQYDKRMPGCWVRLYDAKTMAWTGLK